MIIDWYYCPFCDVLDVFMHTHETGRRSGKTQVYLRAVEFSKAEVELIP